MLSDLISFDFYFVNELIVSCRDTLFLAEEDVYWLLSQIHLNTHRKIFPILLVELLPSLLFSLDTRLEQLTDLLDGLVLCLSSYQLIDCLVVCFRKFAWNAKDKAVI